MFLNNQQVTEEMKMEIKTFLVTSDNENTTQNLWDAVKAVLRGKFIAIQSYLKKQEKHQIDNLTLHLKQLEKEGKKISRRKEIIKIQAEINEKEIKETTVKVNKINTGSLKRETKLTNHYPDSSRKKKRRIKSTKLEMKKERLQQTMQKHKKL